MKSFPKKYDPRDLYNWSKLYKEKLILNEDLSIKFSTNVLYSSKKLSYRDFFLIYLKDFFGKKRCLETIEKENNISYEQLFVISSSRLNSLTSSYEFFLKRNQSLVQVGTDKLERHILSSTKKYIRANHKILDSYLSSNHKVYLPDLDLYTYVLGIFRSLWDSGKIVNETKIGYRSFNLQTSIPLERITWREEKVPFYTLKYFIGAKGDALYVPIEGDIDTCCGDVALLVHPKDKRYSKYIGKNAIIPLCNRQIPVIGDENVSIAVNNGIQRICPCSDDNSIYLAEKFGLPTDIYAFDKQGLYTEYIHEPAFIGKERSKYYDNIVKFIDDIGNVAEIGERIAKVPYLEEIDEPLVPYKMNQLIVDLAEEKENVIEEFFENGIKYPLLQSKISEFVEGYDFNYSEDVLESDKDEIGLDDSIIDEQCIKQNRIKQKIASELDEVLPNSLLLNTQIPFGWRIPLIIGSDGDLSFFDIEKDCLKWKEDPLQFCFNFVLLSMVRIGTIHIKNVYGDTDEYKICEYDKFYRILLDNEKKVEYFIQQLSKITGEKAEYLQFMKLVGNLSEGNKSDIKILSDLVKNCKVLNHKGIWLLLNIKGLMNDVIDPDFIQLCIPCYLEEKGIKMDSQSVFTEDKKNNIFKELLIQQLLLGHKLSDKLVEESYCKGHEFLGDKELTKFHLDQSQWDFFSLYGENPIRLSFLLNKTFNQKEVVINSIFLKQIRNAVRLCDQKEFLPKDIKSCLDNQPQDFDDYDIIVLGKLDELLNEWENVESYQEYIKFFNNFKDLMQNRFFSRYLEILKIRPTVGVQFVCSYFLNFLLTILYPLVPEFVEALQYVSGRNFLNPIKLLELNKTVNYSTNILYDTFIKIKQLKIENDIKQHKTCNVFIKSTPTICDIFAENEQIFKNYFHIPEINYIRLHEANPLGYEIFTDELITIGIQCGDSKGVKEKDSIETLEMDIKNLEDKLILIRQRIQILPDGEQRLHAEEEYAKTKEEIENLTIKYSLLSSK